MRKANREDIFEIIQSVGSISVDVNDIAPDEDLNAQGIDSVDMMSVFFEIEDRFSITIDEESLQNKTWFTVDEIVESTNSLMSEKGVSSEAPRP